MMEVVVKTEAIRHAILHSSRHHQQINTHFFTAGCYSCHPTNSDGALKGKRVGMSESAVSEKLTLDATVRLFKCFPCHDILRFYCFHLLWTMMYKYPTTKAQKMTKVKPCMYIHCVSKNPCDYVFGDNLNSKRPIVIIFGTIIT